MSRLRNLMVAGAVPPLPLLLMEEVLRKTYRHKFRNKVTLAGLGFFSPYFITDKERLQKKIEESAWFRKGEIELMSTVDPNAPIPTPDDASTGLGLVSRKELFGQVNTTFQKAKVEELARIAEKIGVPDENILGSSRAILMKAISERTLP